MIAGLLLVCAGILLPQLGAKKQDMPDETALVESDKSAITALNDTLTEGISAVIDATAEVQSQARAVSAEENSWIRAIPLTEPFLFSAPEADQPIWIDPDEDAVYLLEPTDDPMWYTCVLDDGMTAYAYADHMCETDSEESLFSAYFREKTKLLQSQLPDGKYWNHIGIDDIAWGEETPWIVTDTPCGHSTYGEGACNFYNGAMAEVFPYEGALCQCLGFASLLSDQFFGEDAPVRQIEDYHALRPGDHIRLAEWTHSMLVVAVTDEGISVAECNENYEDCRISWGRTMSWDEVRSYDWDATYYTRYPMD